MPHRRRQCSRAGCGATSRSGRERGTGRATGSLGHVAVAGRSGTDLIAALLTFFAVGVAVRPADTGHQYGHGKAARMFGVPFGKGATVKVRARPPAEAYQFERSGTAARWTFIIDPDGKVAYKNTKVTPADDAKKITAFIEQAQKK